jgi:hypothetical protein
MIRRETVKVTTTGSAGSATGAADTTHPIAGKILKIRFDFHASAPATTDTTVTERETAADWETICTETSSKTDVTRYPRRAVEDNAEATVTYDGTNEIYEPYVICGYMRVAVAQGDALTDCVVVDIFYED